MNRAGLTHQQAEMLAFIESFIVRNRTSPSFDEMAQGLGLGSKSSVFRLVEALVERGRIRRLPNRARAIELVDDPSDFPLDIETALDARCRETSASRQAVIEAALRFALGITRPVFDQRAAESLLRGRA